MNYYYKKKLPSIDDIVIARVETIGIYGIEVSLTEYNHIKGFINCNEISRKKKVNLNKLLTIGKEILLHVIQVDEIKCMIDLSKRTISDDDIKQFTEKHRLHIQLYNLFKQLYMKINNINLIENIDQTDLHNFLCNTLFSIQIEIENDYLIEKIFNKETNNEIIELIDFESINITSDEFKKNLDEFIDKKINRTKPEITETIKLMTYSATGLEDIKYSLDYKSFLEYENFKKDFEIKINYISSSIYSIILIQKEFELVGSNNINDVILMIKKEIKNRTLEKKIQNQIIL
jgi:translation initiation factor 2 alpha subunit (eIF-2alpha)